ncbi:hypothetical protein FRC08_006464 [Ceratobasidium sp. 394]|nr:hypothetical protein FRC08_006464 [Ceratobasidium sp. 394]KAG9095477.1 hypothetical protein FS749_010377 [Ceratobasidium sp. UAMH 11750]
MALRIRVPIPSVSRCIAASRYHTTTSPGASSSRGSYPKLPSSDEHQDFTDETVSRPIPVSSPGPDSPLDSSTAKILSHAGPVILPRRPPVRPPPTLTLPPSVSSLPLRSFLKNKKSLEPRQASAEDDDERAADDLWEVYRESLEKRNTEPTLEDLEALRPAASTIHAALNGVLGTGRTLLPEDHQLHLDLEHLGAQEAPVGGGPRSKKKVVAGSRKAKKLEYLALYEATQSLISRRFTVAQLRQFESEFGTGKKTGNKNDSKQTIIHRIMNSHFRMMHPLVLADVTGKIQKSYPVTPSQLFILLGRDGENLLHVSKQLHLDISVDRDQLARLTEPSNSDDIRTSPRFVLRASGTNTNHQELKKYLEELEKSVSVRMVVLPTGPPLSPSRLQSISRTAGAFCENVNRPSQDPVHETQQPSVLITARDARSAYTAERLVQRAALEDKHRSRIDLISLIQPTQSTSTEGGIPEYSLYPFNTQNFRLQRVKHLKRLPEHASLENRIHFQYRKAGPEHAMDSDEAVIINDPAVVNGWEGRGADEGSLVIEDDPRFGNMVAVSPRGETVDLQQLFSPEYSKDGSVQKVTVTFGHVVFKASSTTLLPPLEGPISIKPALEWVANQANNLRSFVPGVVPPLVHLIPDSTRPIHQLRYRTVDGTYMVDVNVELPSGGSHAVESADNTVEAKDSEHSVTDGFELTGERNRYSPTKAAQAEPVPLEDTIPNGGERPEPAETHVESTEAKNIPEVAEPTPLPSDIVIGTESAVEVLLPDSAMDMSIQVSNTSPLELSRVPEPLINYLNDLSKFFTTNADMFQPDPPQYFFLDDKYYTLVRNTTGRHGIAPVSFDVPGSTVTSESTLDLENNARISFTQALYDRKLGKDGYPAFLRLCQGLAAQPYEHMLNQAKPRTI